MAPARQPPAFVAVDDEPLHVQRWKSDWGVRLVDVRFPPRTASKWHQHLHEGVYICVSEIHATEMAAGDAAPKPLVLQRGDVFCRDHTRDRLVHVVETQDEPMHIIEVELLHDRPGAPPPSPPVLRQGEPLKLVHEDTRCRVYRIALSPVSDSTTIEMPTTAVLVSLNACALVVETADPSEQDHERAGERRTLQPGDDVVLTGGVVTIRVDEWNASKDATFVLCEVL